MSPVLVAHRYIKGLVDPDLAQELRLQLEQGAQLETLQRSAIQWAAAHRRSTTVGAVASGHSRPGGAAQLRPGGALASRYHRSGRQPGGSDVSGESTGTRRPRRHQQRRSRDKGKAPAEPPRPSTGQAQGRRLKEATKAAGKTPEEYHAFQLVKQQRGSESIARARKEGLCINCMKPYFSGLQIPEVQRW